MNTSSLAIDKHGTWWYIHKNIKHFYFFMKTHIFRWSNNIANGCSNVASVVTEPQKFETYLIIDEKVKKRKKGKKSINN